MSRFVCACHSYPLSLCPENEVSDQCDHGHLRRVCEICERDDEIKQLKAERDAAVMKLIAVGHALQGDFGETHPSFRSLELEDAIRLRTERDAAVADADLHRTRCASILFSGAMDDKLAGEVQRWEREYTDAKAERDALLKALKWLDRWLGHKPMTECTAKIKAAIDAAKGEK